MSPEHKAWLIADLERLLQHVRDDQVFSLQYNIDLHHQRVPGPLYDTIERLPGATYKIEFTLMPEVKCETSST